MVVSNMDDRPAEGRAKEDVGERAHGGSPGHRRRRDESQLRVGRGECVEASASRDVEEYSSGD